MKKYFQLLILSLFLLVGCAGVNNSSSGKSSSSNNSSLLLESTNHSEVTNNTSSSTTSSNVISSSTTSSSTTSSKTEIESRWDKGILEQLEEVIGEPVDIPFVEAISYESDIYEDQGVSYVEITCIGVPIEDIMDTYSDICIENGYAVNNDTGSDYLAAKEISITDNIYIQFYSIAGYTPEEDCLKLMVYRYPERVTEWPVELMEIMFFEAAPEFPSKAYQASYYFDELKYSYVFSVFCYYGEDNLIEEYVDLLENEGFEVSNSLDIYFATSDTSNLKIMFYLYDSDTNLVYMTVECNYQNWPGFMFTTLIGCELPSIEGLDVMYDYYYYQHGGLLAAYTSEEYVPALYCDNVDSLMFEAFKEGLIEDGWILQEDEYYEDSLYMLNEGSEDEHIIFTVYSETYRSIAIFVIK